MNPTPKPSNNLMRFVLIFAVVYIATQAIFRFVLPQENETEQQPIVLEAVDATVKDGHHPVLKLTNNTDKELVLADRCPLPPVRVFFVDGATRTELTAVDTVLPCAALPAIAAESEVEMDLAPWKYSFFSRLGTYEVELPLTEAENLNTGTGASVMERTVIGTTFSIHEAGTPTKIFRTFVTKPLLNLLILIASFMPEYDLAIAIILLTILVKLVLFFPTQHALEGQKKLQAIQPRVDALKEQYKHDAQRMNQEVMKLWKEEKINPFQSCLPMLLQFPILIGLFYVIRDGSHLALSRHLLYSMHQHLPWTFDVHFLGLNLLEPNLYVMPLLLVVLQFLQMKLSFAISDRKKAAKQGIVDTKSKAPSAQATQQQVMLYGLPLMIGFFAIQFPAAVSLYWGVSTLFAIGQQLVVNRRVA